MNSRGKSVKVKKVHSKYRIFPLNKKFYLTSKLTVFSVKSRDYFTEYVCNNIININAMKKVIKIVR